MLRSWVETDLERIVKNYKFYKGYTVKNKEAVAVVKANAYGHGDVKISEALEAEGVNFFAVSNINEAVGLRKSGIKGDILVLGYTPPTHLEQLSKYGITQTIVDKNHALELKRYAPRDVKYHLAIDTGMRRIGLFCEKREDVIKEIQRIASDLKICGLFTHLAAADSKREDDINFTKRSIACFDNIAEESRKLGVEFFHCQNSAGALLHESRECNAVRLGISLYGYSPSPGLELPQEILPALSWMSVVCRVCEIKRGDSVGYGRSFEARKNMKIATLTTGYADGYPRAASNKGFALINGTRAPIVGRVCMDMMTVDVSEVKEIKAGCKAVLIGSSGDMKITADDIAKCADTISYEVLAGISSRVERTYKL